MIKRLISISGFSFYPIAVISRLPFAMMVVGVLTLVVAVRGSLFLGGLNSALVGAGTALFGPLIGSLADRFGQRIILLTVGPLNAFFLGIFVWVVYSEAPIWVMFTCAFFIGASAPQTSSMSRSRMIGFVNSGFPAAKRDRALSSVMAYESTIDEMVFVFGPFIVGVLALWFGAGAPVIGAALLTAVFVTLFALHPTARPSSLQAAQATRMAPLTAIFKLDLLVVIIGIFGMGLFFGSMLTSLTAFMQGIDAEARTGILYGAMGLGSAVLALSVAFFPPSFTKRWRWLTFAFLMILGALLVLTVSSETGMLFALIIVGCGIGPILVTQYNFGADRSPLGRNITVMTTLGAAIIVGQSLSSALTGWVSEFAGVKAALTLPLLAILIVTVAGFVNYFLTGSGKDYSKRVTTI